MYEQPEGCGELHCDIGYIQTISSLHTFTPTSTAFAYKIYLYPPSAYLTEFSDPLEALFDRVIQTPLPLFVDANLPIPRVFYTSSPYHLSSIQDRLTSEYVDESRFASGAFDDFEALHSSGTESDEEIFRLDRCQSTVDDLNRRGSLRTPYASRVRGHTEDLEHIDNLPTIITDLSTRIDHLLESQQDLSVSEEITYANSGSYEYNEAGYKGSSSSGDSPIQGKTSPGRLILKRLKSRPKPLILESKKEQGNNGRSYAFHLAYIPDHWEVRGVEMVLKSLKKAPCRVHFCNISSAAAVNKILQFRQAGLSDSATVETCPHYLFFASSDINDGETRLKTFPPIRNRANCNLLWELLKVKAVDVLASHHICVPRELKFEESGLFKKALSGVNGLGYGLQAVWTKLTMPASHTLDVQQRYIVRLAKWMSLNPARLLGISHIKGSVAKGKLADLVVWYPYQECATSENSPYRGKTLNGRIAAVYIRGKKAYEEGVVFATGRVVPRSHYVS